MTGQKKNQTKNQNQKMLQAFQLAVARAPAPQRKNKKVKRTGPVQDNFVHPYVRMVRNPRAALTLAQYPDGSQEPSFVYKHRQVLALSPDSAGNIAFAVIPGVYGGIAVREGVAWTTPVPRYTAASSAAVSGVFTNVFASGTAGTTYFVAAYAANLANLVSGNTAPFLKSGLAFGPSKFRVLSQEVRSEFTGASLADNGSVLVSKYNLDPALNTNITAAFNGVAGNSMLVNAPPTSLGMISSSASTELFTARTSLCSILGNPDPKFQPIYDNTMLNSANASGAVLAYASPVQVTAGTSIIASPCFNVDPDVAPNVYMYSNVASTASITVEVVTLIEYGLAANSSVAGMAQPNPPRQKAVSDVLQRMFSFLPAAQSVASAMQGVGSFVQNNRGAIRVASRLLPLAM